MFLFFLVLVFITVKLYQILRQHLPTFPNTLNEVRLKYSTACYTFNSLLCVSLNNV